MTSGTQRTWNLGFTLLIIAPFIGLLIVLFDPPRWIEITAVVAIIALVFVGTRLFFRKQGGWRPSETLPEQRSDNDH